MANSEDSVAAKLEIARKDLLDLGFRNPLLNYRPLRTRGVEVVDERPIEVFRLLVREGKSMSFSAAPDTDASGLLAQPEESETPDTPAARHTDLRLQTALSSSQLQTRLLATYYTARTFIEEQGVNTLFIALGMLNWYEAESSQERRRAPLLLVPVELERSNARERFHLRYTEEDIEENLSLAAKLKAEFGMTLRPLPDSEDLDVGGYFDAIAQVVQSQARWSVDRDTVVLGFFSFGKFLMYRDLDVANWPENMRPIAHPILWALLHGGFHEPALTIADDEFLDRHLRPTEVHHVMDADSSQTLAILDVNNGRNLVIQGPPGTGKSQTITNLIAEAIGRGKTVLFIAEKMAALEVVKRRLDSVGLGDACLELHSHKTQKKAALTELARTLELGKPRLGQLESDLALFSEMRERLNAYCEAVNTPIGKSGVSPYHAFGELIQLRQSQRQDAIVRFDLPSLPSWTEAEFKRRQALIEELQTHLAALGLPQNHPFWGSRRIVLLPTEQDRLREALLAAQRATKALRDAVTNLACSLGLSTSETRSNAETLCRAAWRAMQAPRLSGVQLRTGEWRSRQDDLDKLLIAGTALADLHRRYDEVLIPDAWERDVLEIRQNLAVYGHKWWRFLSSTYRRTRKGLASLYRKTLPADLDQQIELVDAVLEAYHRQTVVRRGETLGANLFGVQWQGEHSDWSVLTRLFEWIVQLYRDVGDGQLPEGIMNFLAGSPKISELKPEVVAVETALANHLNSVHQVVALLEFDAAVRFKLETKFEDLSFTTQDEILALWSSRLNDLRAIVAFNHLAESCRKESLESIVQVVESWPAAGHCLVAAFRYTWFTGLLDKAFQERSALAQFSGESHTSVVRKFRELDTLTVKYNRARLAQTHWQKLPQHEGDGQLGILRREFEKKSRHLPIRQLMLKAGNAVQAIKPVFMMSPLSVSTFLAPDSVKFDLVIFDEASQVKPVDAFGAILRGKQVVVVGDSQQLPPTSFFDALTKGDEVDEDDVTGDIESILGLCVAQGMPQRMLRWHYRSRHESLIAVSNHEFYKDRLVIFPSPDADRQDVGLSYHHLPLTSYDRGKSRTNAQEAKIVAQAVMEHAQSQLRRIPEQRLTLGVAAFSVAQMQAIQDQLELLRRQDPSCEEFFAAHPHEPFFVKNLETVQGDERDVILISIGYGRTAEGYVAMDFGPLNRDGGERRLNVLITRARMNCGVFTNLTADEIDLHRTNARGVRALKVFLAYAHNGKLDVPVVTGRDVDSPFEAAVLSELTGLGYQVTPQVGSAGFFIDLAVIDAARPGHYLLGIECDGATYHSARSARDRDRLRQQVLEGLGWRIHRIWSTDWFHNPERELKRVVAAIEEAKLYTSPGPQVPSARGVRQDVPIERDHEKEQKGPVNTIIPYKLASLRLHTGGQGLYTIPIPTLASWVTEVVRIESPVHVSEVARRITDAAGIKRIGSRIQTVLESAYTHAVRSGTIRRQREFLWLKDMPRLVIRDRSNLPASTRKMDLVVEEEIALAVRKVVADAYGVEIDDLPSAVSRLLGFVRVTDDMRDRIEAIVYKMVADRRLIQQGSHLVVLR